MLEMISSQSLAALFQVVMIDLVLAGDNAIVIGLAAAGLPEDKRKKAILAGILAATALRIGFASVTVQLLQIIGLLLAGAMFLSIGLWVSSLVKSQMVAAMLALAINLVFILGGLLILGGFLAPPSDAGELSYRVINFISVPLHFSRDFCRGIIDTRHVVLYVSVTIACLFLTVKALDSRRWR